MRRAYLSLLLALSLCGCSASQRASADAWLARASFALGAVQSVLAFLPASAEAATARSAMSAAQSAISLYGRVAGAPARCQSWVGVEGAFSATAAALSASGEGIGADVRALSKAAAAATYSIAPRDCRFSGDHAGTADAGVTEDVHEEQ